MIKVSGLKASQGRIVRETTAPFITLDDDGDEAVETIRVRYYALSIAESADFRKNTPDDALWSQVLFPLLESLPDFVDDKEKPVKVTEELLEGFNTLNLQAIFQAIQEDLSPKGQPKKKQTG